MESFTPPNPVQWWANRRRLAWGAFAVAVLETVSAIVLALYFPTAITALGVVFGWSYGLWGTIIATYIGCATWSDVVSAKN